MKRKKGGEHIKIKKGGKDRSTERNRQKCLVEKRKEEKANYP